MLFSFKRNKKKAPDKADYFQGNLLRQLEEANLRLQHKCAHWMEKKTAHLSRKSWILILICFTVLTSGYSIYLMIGSFSDTAINVEPITTIVKLTNGRQAAEKDKLNVPISEAEFEKIVRFRKYMERPGHSATGKKVQDSIMRYRPGLLDSLIIVEKYYHSQFKK
jgi:hypothetical protein